MQNRSHPYSFVQKAHKPKNFWENLIGDSFDLAPHYPFYWVITLL